jgi:hypothetical protein
MNEEKLHRKLEQSEDPWVERKESYQEEKVLRTLVGFANSVPDGEESAVLFLGASNKGVHPGIGDADDLQKKLTGLMQGKAYPPIKISMTVFSTQVAGKRREILSVEVPPSPQKPHFSGAAWMRKGSETIRASAEMLDELIASRNDKVRRLQKFKGSRVMLSLRSRPTGLRIDYYNARLMSVNATTTEIDTTEGFSFPFSTNAIESFDQLSSLVRINAPSPWTEQEHIQKMILRWAWANPDTNGISEGPTKYLAEQLLTNLRLTLDAIRWEAKRSPTKALNVLRSTAEMIAREQRIGP